MSVLNDTQWNTWKGVEIKHPPLCPRVTLQNRSAVILRIRAEVVDQHLEVFDLQVSTVHLWCSYPLSGFHVEMLTFDRGFHCPVSGLDLYTSGRRLWRLWF